jgi:hypothetical protein
VAKKTKMPTDANQRGKAIVDLITGDREVVDPDVGKDPRAVEAGRIGGKKGGNARAEKLTLEERSAIARRAVQARWAKQRQATDSNGSESS